MSDDLKDLGKAVGGAFGLAILALIGAGAFYTIIENRARIDELEAMRLVDKAQTEGIEAAQRERQKILDDMRVTFDRFRTEGARWADEACARNPGWNCPEPYKP